MKILNSTYNSVVATMLILVAIICVGCHDELPDYPDYSRVGEDVELVVKVELPNMPKATRAELDEASLNTIQSLWVRTYNSQTGEATSDWFKYYPDANGNIVNPIKMTTKSGPSYIVAVGNVDNLLMGDTEKNYGYTKDDISNAKPLDELLEAADTWEDFLNIAVVAPWEQEHVRAPQPPLVMAGCYSDLIMEHGLTEPTRLDEWQSKDFQSYFIPAQRGAVEFNGAIHLRRLVSHINFRLASGDPNMNLEVYSYQVYNAPKYSWLYERPTSDNYPTNFGDYSTSAEDAKRYYSTVPVFNVQNITINDDGSSSFDFWVSENKHIGTSEKYSDRELRNSGSVAQTRLFRSLTGDTWTPNNMATFVAITGSIEYENPIWVDNNGKVVPEGSEGAEAMMRTADVTYLVHLGYINGQPEEVKSKDFNCFRNVDYTYTITVNGVNDIRVDAQATDETYHGEEGVVVDLNSTTTDLDGHYAAFNIELKDSDLKDANFGFIIITYDYGEAISITDEMLQTGTGTGKEIHSGPNASDPVIDPKYYNWIELRPTSGEFVLADYKPRFGANSDGKTFLLTDLYSAPGSTTSIHDMMQNQGILSSSGYYTVFINEYTYEPLYTGTESYANETVLQNGKPAWMSYVNENPRRAYIRVSRDESPDGKSSYARSKYALSQQSLQSFYSDQIETPGHMAIAMERINETDGMNIRHAYSGGSSINNGRWNTAQWFDNTGSGTNLSINNANVNSRPLWSNYITANEPLQVGEVSGPRAQGGPVIEERTIANGNPLPQPGLKKVSSNYVAFNDPQPTNDYTIEYMNACMCRNRDNNGNGRIDPDELRWYVPGMDQYLQLVLGSSSLPSPLMNFARIPSLPYVNTSAKQWANGPDDGEINMSYYSRYLFISSNNINAGGGSRNLLWGMEGVSTSRYIEAAQWAGMSNAHSAWGLRCVRNLGTDMTQLTQDFNVDRAFTRQGNRFYMSYYDVASIRANPALGNGTSSGQMPVNTIHSRYNKVYYSFEFSDIDIPVPDAYRPATNNTANYRATLSKLHEYINSNPCANAGLTGTGWRIPNQDELSIMRNAGLLESGNSSTTWLSCTVNYFNFINGIGSSTDVTDRHFMGSLPGWGLLLAPGNLSKAYGAGFYIRCIRDRN